MTIIIPLCPRIPVNPVGTFRQALRAGSALGNCDCHLRRQLSNKLTQAPLEGAEDVADSAADRGKALSKEKELKTLTAKIGQQALEIDFLSGALGRIDDPSAKGTV